MDNYKDNEREKLLLHSLTDTVQEEQTKTQTLQTNVSTLQTTVSTLQSNIDDFMEENMINTTDLENGIDDLNTTNTNLKNTLNDKLQALTVAVRGIGADFTQVNTTTSDVKSGKKFFDDDGLLQTGALATYSDSATITTNGTVATANKFMASDLTVAVPRPQLNAPTLSITDDTLTITNTNGNFAVNFQIYSNNTLLCTTSNTSVDLTNYLDVAGTYTITAICTGTNFEDSVASSSVTYTIAQSSTLTTVAQITALLNDYQSEDDINTSTSQRVYFSSLFGNSTPAKIWFRHNPTNLSNVQLAFEFVFSNLPENTTSVPISITLNSINILTTSLTTDSNGTASTNVNLENLISTYQLFNEICISFTDSSQASAVLDYINLTISNTKNCLILNRDTSMFIDGIRITSESSNIEYVTIYTSNCYYGYYGGSGQDITNVPTTPTQFTYTTINSNPIKYASRNFFTLYNTDTSKFSYSSLVYQEAYVSQDNTLSAVNVIFNNTITNLANNVSYAQKSSYNGTTIDNCNFYCCTHFDFDVSGVGFQTSGTYQISNITTYNVTLNNTNLPKEFIDFVPVDDYFILTRTEQIKDCGYLLLHKSGNIIFIDNLNASYALLIGKGRQINASMDSDGLSIIVFYNLDNKVVKKTLTRTAIGADWTLSDTVQEYNDYKEAKFLHNMCLTKNLSYVIRGAYLR